MMLPFLAGLGIQQWISDYKTPLMWTAAIAVAGLIAYSDRIPRRRGAAMLHYEQPKHSPLPDEEKIKITLPSNGEALIDKQPLGQSFSYAVRGTLKSLPEGCKIWLLTSDQDKYWPQTFYLAQYGEATGNWEGRIHTGSNRLRIIALVASPTSQQFFRYYQKVGNLRQRNQEKTPCYEPLDAIPAECRNLASVNTQTP
jgi:hypothetical protein